MPQTQDWFTANAPAQPSEIGVVIRGNIDTGKTEVVSGQGGDWFAAHAPTADRPPDFKVDVTAQDPNTIGTLARSFWKTFNPVNIGQMLPWPKVLGGSGTDNPLLPHLDAAQQLRKDADAKWDAGDHVGASARYVESVISLLPVIGSAGPMLAHQGDLAQQHKWAALTGELTGILAGAKSAGMLSDVAAAKYPLAQGARGQITPTTQQTPVQFGLARGVPLDAATASDNFAVKGVQQLADRSLGGSVVATPANAARSAAMARVGDELSMEAHPVPVTPEQAGTGVRTTINARVTHFADQAEAAYQQAEAIAKAKAQTVQTGTRTADTGVLDASGKPVIRETPITKTFNVPFDVTPVKTASDPLYQELLREAELVPLQGGKARALTALDRLMKGPDTVSLMTAERASSDIGALAGHPDLPALRTPGEGTAAQAFGNLRGQIDRTASLAGPDLIRALQQGRAATRAKYAAADVLDTLNAEPVRTIKALTAPKDAAIQSLRAVLTHAPDQAPVIARAYLEDLFEKPQAVAEWRKLGSETKGVLFQKPGLSQSLDRLFQLTDRISKTNVNPSGSGYYVGLGAQLPMFWSAPLEAVGLQLTGAALAKLLRSPAVVDALANGLKLPATAPAQLRLATLAPLIRAAQAAGATTAVPAAAQTTTPTGSDR